MSLFHMEIGNENLKQLVETIYSTDQNLPHEKRDESVLLLIDFQTNEPILFVETLIELIVTATDQKICTQYITLLYSSIFHNQIFININHIHQIFLSIQQAYEAIINDTLIDYQTKINFSIAFGFIVGHYYLINPEDEEPKIFFMELVSNEENSKDQVFETIYEMIITTKSKLYFSTEDITTMLNTDVTLECHFKIFAAIASFSELPKDLSELFLSMLIQVTDDVAPNIFNNLSLIARNKPSFFFQFFDDFIPLICNFISEGSRNTKIIVMFFIKELVKSDRVMCASSKLFYQSIIQSLAEVIASVSDNDPLDISNSETTPYTVACEIYLYIIFELRENDAHEFVFEIAQQIIEDSNSTSEQISAAFILLSGPNVMAINPNFFYSAIEATFDSDPDQRLLYSALFAFHHTNKEFLKNPHYLSERVVEVFFECAKTEEIPREIRIMALKCIKTLALNTEFQMKNDVIEALIEAVVECSDDEIMEKYLIILSKFIKYRTEEDMEIFRYVPQIVSGIIETEQPKLIICALWLFSFYAYKIDFDELSEEEQNILISGLEYIDRIRNDEETIGLTGKDFRRANLVFRSIISLLPIDILGEKLESILDFVSTRIQSPMSVNEVPISERLMDSSIIMVVSDNPGVQLYIEKEEFESYQNEWNLLNDIASSLNSEKIPQIAPIILELIGKYMESETRVVALDDNIWMVINALSSKVDAENLEKFIEIFNSFINYSDIQQTYHSTPMIISNLNQNHPESEIVNQATSNSLLVEFKSFPSLVEAISKTGEKIEQWRETENEDYEFFLPSQNITHILSLFEEAIRICPEQAKQIYDENIDQLVQEMMTNTAVKNEMTGLFLNRMLIDCSEEWLLGPFREIVEEGYETNDDYLSVILEFIYNLFDLRGNDFSSETKKLIIEMIPDPDFESCDIESDDSRAYAISKILLTMPESFGDPEYARLFIDLLPVKYNNEKIDSIFLLFYKFIEADNEFFSDFENMADWMISFGLMHERGLIDINIFYKILCLSIAHLSKYSFIENFVELTKEETREGAILMNLKNSYNDFILKLRKNNL